MYDIADHGYLRVAAASPRLRVTDCTFNVERHLDLLDRAEAEGCDLVVFPECSLTGYTCGDLFHQKALQEATLAALQKIKDATRERFRGVAVVGSPFIRDGLLFNAAAIVSNGLQHGLVTKRYLPTNGEFYDGRYFAAGPCEAEANPVFWTVGRRVESIGIEICEDLWTPIPPSSRHALDGATVLVNLSASNETVGKHEYRRQLVAQQSARCLAAYVYAGAGVGESTQDLVFGGHCLIAENGQILAESERFSRDDQLIIADIDLDRLHHERIRTSSFRESVREQGMRSDGPVLVRPPREAPRTTPKRTVDPHPFVPADPATLHDRCREIFSIQVAGLAKRLEHVGLPTVSIGVSGGLDSTLALLVLVKTADLLGMPHSKIRGLTMPGFGTTAKTLANARLLMERFGITADEIDITAMCFEQMVALKHEPFGLSLTGETPKSLTAKLKSLPKEKRHDLVFENVQARVRTNLLMNAGFQIGTGDLSELALGWCTYNADHMSMYNPNIGVPKTLVRFLVRFAADHEFDGDVRGLLHDVANTVISPELLPTTESGEIIQATEDTVGPYELHDFFLFHILRFGTPPEKVLFLATIAFDEKYAPAEIRRWLAVFLRRFFSSQFKRSCLPDGPKVGSVTLSPRGDWRMPSDAVATEWLKRVE
jgi:NAD+ synthase (glutamine-hydrolysing)